MAINKSHIFATTLNEVKSYNIIHKPTVEKAGEEISHTPAAGFSGTFG
jgi:hypothetical protein